MTDVPRRARVLGRVRLETDDGVEVPLPAGRIGQLLCWFLLRPNETHAADDLSEMLWPGDGETSRDRLHVVVGRLRRFLGYGAGDGGSGLVVVTAEDGYRLEADRGSLDRVAFEDLAVRALGGELDVVPEALALWAGEPYTGIPDSDERLRHVAHLYALRHRLGRLIDRSPSSPSLRGELARTKFLRPRTVTGHLVLRPRLLDLAGRVGETTILAVSAPAGFGKSVLLSQWAEAQSVPVGWVTLDADDSDPVRFWSAVHHGFGFADGLDLPPMPDATPGSPRFVQSLTDALAAVGTPIGLVLDDFHCVDNDELLAELGEHLATLPSWLTVAVGTRNPAAVGELAEQVRVRAVTADDLRFSPAEVEDVLGMGDDGDGRDVAAITRATAGWPIAVAYLGRTGGGVAEPLELADHLDDYVVDEVLQTVPAPVERFLLETAHLQRLGAPLCDAVRGRDDSAAHLDWLHSRDLFVTAARDDTGWYQCHAIVAAVLCRRAGADPGIDVAEGQRRAARWCRAHDLDEEALRYGMASGEDDVVAALAGSALMAATRRGELYRCEQLLQELDPDVVAANRSSHDLALLAFTAWLDPDRARPWLASRRRFESGDDIPAMSVKSHQLAVLGSAAGEHRARRDGHCERRSILRGQSRA